jgi:hypothetical protein
MTALLLVIASRSPLGIGMSDTCRHSQRSHDQRACERPMRSYTETIHNRDLSQRGSVECGSYQLVANLSFAR